MSFSRHISFYNSDTGSRRDLGSERTYPRETPEDVIIEKAIELAKKNGSDSVVVIRTKPYGKKPGAWYIKGFATRFSYEDLRAKIQANVVANEYTRRDCWLIRIRKL